MQPHAPIVKLFVMAKYRPEAALNAAKEQGKATTKAKEQEKDLTRRMGLVSLVKVEGVCAEGGISFIGYMPKEWVQRRPNYRGGSPGCKCGPCGLLEPG